MIVKNRDKGRRLMKRKRRSHLFIWVVLAGLLSGITAGGFLALLHDLPQIQSLENYTPSAVTRIYSADQVLLAELFIERRDPVPLSEIPQDLITALLATEDRRFYEHSGIAVRGILRAAVKNVIQRRYAEGASTLTQQLSKTLFLTPRKTMIRKFREAILSLQLERRYTKNEILELYLNQIYLGSGAYGVGAAARIYFGKSVKDLTLAECALVAGLPKSPSRYSPLNNPELARKRRDIVLKQMLSIDAIDQENHDRAVNEPVNTVASGPRDQNASYFIDHIKKEIEQNVGADLMYKGGLTVNTTLPFHLQQAAEKAVQDNLALLDERRRRNAISGPPAQAALVAVQNRTGAIIAMVGGRDGDTAFNRATVARRQPGSAFKPIVYALAIEQGFEQNQTLLDAPVVFQRSQQQKYDWQPENFSGTYDGEISLRWALMHSKNIPAVRLIEKIGPTAVIRFAHDLGIGSDLKPDLSLALGSYEVNLLELTNAYSVFANDGKYIGAYGLAEILDADGKAIWRPNPVQRIVMSPVGASIITDMLTAVIEGGTAQRARHLPGPLAGKTGTTDDNKDALFIGYSPSITCGVWVGMDDATPLGPGETGAKAALPIWMDFIAAAIQGQPQQYFDIPAGVRKIYIEPKSGKEALGPASTTIAVLVRAPS
jgi:penicillin-binding protein 1A